jgi:hypothetical protein
LADKSALFPILQLTSLVSNFTVSQKTALFRQLAKKRALFPTLQQDKQHDF